MKRFIGSLNDRTWLNDRGVDGPVNFARQGQWVMGHAAAKFADEVWSDEALE